MFAGASVNDNAVNSGYKEMRFICYNSEWEARAKNYDLIWFQ